MIWESTASCTKLWYSPKAPHTRHKAETPAANILETSKRENLLNICRELASYLQETQRKFRKLAGKTAKTKSRNHKRHIALFDTMVTLSRAELHNQGAAGRAPLDAFGLHFISISSFGGGLGRTTRKDCGELQCPPRGDAGAAPRY